ncbi:anti-sigma factor [Cellulomonas sp. C5510]|uniref:anti-sigma factor n=1 Tax=Cellulomonas sp. C5510 TaxID=2871170 RepID=UPI00210448A6|nr:anti-sigma factor [Cellulomonas sp. C5510]
MPGAAVVPLPRRRARRALLAVAAAGLVVGGTAGGLVVAGLQRGDQEQVVARTVLDALPGWAASGDAVVEEDLEGRRTLVVRLEGGEADGFREVWLLDRDVTGLVSLGLLDGDEGRFAIPAGLDLGRYPVVDVSAEPDDGDPAHSGDSILRGELTAPA